MGPSVSRGDGAAGAHGVTSKALRDTDGAGSTTEGSVMVTICLVVDAPGVLV